MDLAIQHPMLQPDSIEFRGYQANLARIAAQQDTLVVLPTGMGKTIVALLAVADAWKNGARRILIMAPTRPLVDQHAQFFAQAMASDWTGAVTALTGNISPAKRTAGYGKEGIVVATPQVIHNDLLADRIQPAPDWIIYDECHRAVGEYPYAFIGQTMRRLRPNHRRLGLTASPGHDIKKIDEVRLALGLNHVEIRTPADPDVIEYVQEINMSWETLPLPPSMDAVTRLLDDALAERVKAMKEIGVLKTSGRPSRRALLDVAQTAQRAIKGKDPDSSWFQVMTLQAQAMKLQHALEQCQTQGAAALVAYVDGMRKDATGPKASKASKVIVDDDRVNQAYQIARNDDAENPKMGRVESLVQEQLERSPESRVIVFTHYRTTCEMVAARLSQLPGITPAVFVGQGKRKGQNGLSQKQQGAILDEFRAGKYNVLVATSVAEEGLDIPSTDLVVFYEPIPSEIRSIQRRGRTGRQEDGKVVVLITKGTGDEAAHWSSRRKEQAMIRELQALRLRLSGEEPAPPHGQTRLDAKPTRNPQLAASPSSSGPIIICDHREQAGGVVRHLHQMGAKIDTRQLDIADFVLSDRIAVERKTAEDFIDSLVDGRLFDQLKRLKEYPRPFMILEGDGLSTGRNVSPEAIMGAVASITVDYGVPILQTRTPEETARFLLAVAKREQGRAGRHVGVRSAPATANDDDVSLAILGGIPGVSQVRAQTLLLAFGSVGGVLAASETELASVDGVGPKIAHNIRHALRHLYGSPPPESF